MIQMRNIWRACRVVERLGDKLDADNPPPLQSSGVTQWNPTAVSAKNEYMRAYKTSQRNANFAFSDATKLKYLISTTRKHEGVMHDVFYLSTAGRKLTDGYIWGLLREYVKEDGRLILNIISTLGAFVTGLFVN